MLSPSSASKAEKLGYTNVKIYHDGLPAWKKAGNLIVSTSQYVKENMDKDMPQVIIDLRPRDEAQKGHIKKRCIHSVKGNQYCKRQIPC